MTAKEKVLKIQELNDELSNWEYFCFDLKTLIEDNERSSKNYRSLYFKIKTIFNIGKINYNDDFRHRSINNNLELLKLNYNFAFDKIELIKKEIELI